MNIANISKFCVIAHSSHTTNKKLNVPPTAPEVW